MTVAEYIEKLKAFPQDLQVAMEGPSSGMLYDAEEPYLDHVHASNGLRRECDFHPGTQVVIISGPE